MKTRLIVGGSKGIGKAVLQKLVSYCKRINISRTAPSLFRKNINHHSSDILRQDLPYLVHPDGFIYYSGTSNLKSISRLSLEDFEINALGAVKAIQHYLPILKNGSNSFILLFSTVVSKDKKLINHSLLHLTLYSNIT